mmetsp:Transcript_5966/g.12716  ORF Transcript_5966/g.12716 Transcript_5966/m.12716 type:complete len:473 (+) Transcript_5966:2830-4248(+)
MRMKIWQLKATIETVSSLSSLSKKKTIEILENFLTSRGYITRHMGVVWKDALCIEDLFGTRAAICIECVGESEGEWTDIVDQQKLIERVGWKCLRVDARRLLVNFFVEVNSIEQFLGSAGVIKQTSVSPVVATESFESEGNSSTVNGISTCNSKAIQHVSCTNHEPTAPYNTQKDEIVTIGSDNNNEQQNDKTAPADLGLPPSDEYQSSSDAVWKETDPNKYGNIVDLSFLQRKKRGIEKLKNLDFQNDDGEWTDDDVENFGKDRVISDSDQIEKSINESNISSSESYIVKKRKYKAKSQLQKYRGNNEDLEEIDTSSNDGELKTNRYQNSHTRKSQRSHDMNTCYSSSKLCSAENNDIDEGGPQLEKDTDTGDGNLKRQSNCLKLSQQNNSFFEMNGNNGQEQTKSESKLLRKRHSRRLSKYAKDGRYYPTDSTSSIDAHNYDTDSDLNIRHEVGQERSSSFDTQIPDEKN